MTIPAPCVDMESLFTRSLSIGGWDADGIDADGTQWVLESMNWDDTPPVRANFPVRAGRSGAVPQRAFYGARVLTFTGTAVAADQFLLAKAKATLRGLARGLESGTDIVGHMADGDYMVTGYRSADWKVAPLTSRALRYDAVVTCPDWRVFSAGLHSATASLVDNTKAAAGPWKFPATFPAGFTPGAGAGVMLIPNDGTEYADAVITIYGPGTGLTVAEQASGSRLTISSLAQDQFAVLDTDDNTLMLMGYQPRRDLLAAGSEWFQIPPGGTEIVFSAALFSTARVTVSWRYAW